MTVEEFSDNLNQLITALDTGLGNQLAEVANDMIANVELRVIGTGESADGSKFSPYSRTPLPAFFFKQSATRLKKGLNQIETLQKNGKKLSYAEFRNLIGKQSAFKNFQLQGEMWASYKVTNKGEDFVKMGMNNIDAQNKLRWNSNREGKTIIAPNKEEIDFAGSQMDEWVLELWKKYMP